MIGLGVCDRCLGFVGVDLRKGSRAGCWRCWGLGFRFHWSHDIKLEHGVWKLERTHFLGIALSLFGRCIART